MRYRRFKGFLSIVLLAALLSGCVATNEDPEPVPTSAPLTDPVNSTATATAAPAGMVGAAPIVAAVDAGQIDHATGTPTYLDGVLLSYTVAAEDDMELIAARFQLTLGYLTNINSVRRNGWDLYVGDTINLSAFHMFSIGDQNGAVADNPPPTPYPTEQRAADEP